jgi:predicted metalloendopeptidase
MVHYNTKKKYITNQNKTKKNKKLLFNLNDDYYSYVNYPWIETQSIPNNRESTNSFVLLQNKIDIEMKDVLTTKIFKEKTQNDIRCINLYESFVKWNDSLVETQIYSFIQQFNTFLKNPDKFYKFITWFMKSGVRTPIMFDIIYDPKNVNQYICEFGSDGIAFNKKEIYMKKDKPNEKYRQQYIKFIDKIFYIIFGPHNCYKGQDVLEIEISLAKHAHLNEITHIEDMYNVFSNKELLQKCNFNFNEFCFYMKIKKIPTKIMITNPPFFINFMSLMNEWTSSKWTSYWVFQILLSAGKYHSKIFKENFLFFSVFMNNIKTPISMQKLALYKIERMMNTTLSKTYLKYYTNKKEIIFCTLLCKRIKDIFKKRLENNNWIHHKTKKHAILKLEKMNFIIGYKDKWEEDPDCVFYNNDGWGNDIKYAQWSYENIIDKYNKNLLQKKYWERNNISVFNVNAFYNNLTNELILPNAILQPPFVDIKKGLSYNLAYIGSIIAHEVVHGFDSEGCKFNEQGSYIKWWNNDDLNSYKKKQIEIIKQYELIAKKDKYNINGNVTLTENIADIAGFSIIEDVLESYLNELGIIGETQYPYFKKLYYYYTKQWRSIMKVKAMHNLLNIDPHSISKHRVNGVLMRSWRFETIFNIQKGDGMYFKNKDTIW